MKWINCSEQMPEENVPHLVINHDGKMQIMEWHNISNQLEHQKDYPIEMKMNPIQWSNCKFGGQPCYGPEKIKMWLMIEEDL